MVVSIRCGVQNHRQPLGWLEIDLDEVRVGIRATGGLGITIAKGQDLLKSLSRVAAKRNVVEGIRYRMDRLTFDSTPPTDELEFVCPRHGKVVLTAGRARAAASSGQSTVLALSDATVSDN